MPEGWMVGRDGRPLTDPARREDCFMLPIGGAEDFGLSVAILLLAGSCDQAAFGSNVIEFTRESDRASNTGHFVVAIDIAAFGPLDAFEASVSRAFDELHVSAPLPGHDAVRLPGDGRIATMASRRDGGLALHPDLVADLDAIAPGLGVELLHN